MYESGDTYPTKAEFLVLEIGQLTSDRLLPDGRSHSASGEACSSLINPRDSSADGGKCAQNSNLKSVLEHIFGVRSSLVTGESHLVWVLGC